MITLNDIAEIAEISKCSALRMAERNRWESRKANINKRLINIYNITREDVKNATSQKQKKRLAAPKITPAETGNGADQLSTEPQLLSVEQIKQIANIKRHRVREIIQRAGWKHQRLLKCGHWTLHYMVSEKQIADAAADYFNSTEIFEKPKSNSKLPFDGGWVSEWGEAPTLTILKNLDDLTTPWGAHPAKSIIKKPEIFPAAA